LVLAGGKIPARFKEEAEKWIPFISRFLTAVNRENGSLSLDPFASYPNKTYVVLETIQNVFIKMIKDKTEAAIKKSRRR